MEVMIGEPPAKTWLRNKNLPLIMPNLELFKRQFEYMSPIDPLYRASISVERELSRLARSLGLDPNSFSLRNLLQRNPQLRYLPALPPIIVP